MGSTTILRNHLSALAIAVALHGSAQVGQFILSGGGVLPDLDRSDRVDATDDVGFRLGVAYEAGDREGLRVGFGLEFERLNYTLRQDQGLLPIQSGRGNFVVHGAYQLKSFTRTDLDGVFSLLVGGSSVRWNDGAGWKFRNDDEGVVFSARAGLRYGYRISNWFGVHVYPNVTVPIIQGRRETYVRENALEIPRRSVQVGLTLGLVLGPFNVQPRSPDE